jgi:radical SAM protein with 4Fe4S-binding SPASM domain
MTDKFKMDSHKLMYHVERVADWLNKKNIYPIYVEISPTGACNHRCTFCSEDFMGYQKRRLDTEILKMRLEEMGGLGVKSIMYAGEGEPFLHKDFTDLVIHTKQSGIDIAITTNGVLMTPATSDKILGATEWIKVSCNAGTPETYSKLHQARSGDFDRVIANMKYAVDARRVGGYKCTLGMQILLLPENKNEVEQLAKTARDIGLDYLVVKPYTHHVKNVHKYEIEYHRYQHLSDRLETINTNHFQTIFRIRAMEKWDSKQRNYETCLALPFWSYIDAGGNVWGCSAYLQDNRFLYGNIHSHTFKKIWEGEKRLQSLRWVDSDLDIKGCKVNCRMDEVNRYLWELKNLPEHVNFI